MARFPTVQFGRAGAVDVVEGFGMVVGVMVVGVDEFECDRSDIKRATLSATTATSKSPIIVLMDQNLVGMTV